jgi:hypothetical protein
MLHDCPRCISPRLTLVYFPQMIANPCLIECATCHLPPARDPLPQAAALAHAHELLSACPCELKLPLEAVAEAVAVDAVEDADETAGEPEAGAGACLGCWAKWGWF